MITRNNLPETFRPYERLVFCSNVLIGGGHLLVVGEIVPLVIGGGEQPQVWLQAPATAEAKEYVLLIEASVSKHPAVNVISGSEGLAVTVGGTRVLRVKQITEQSAEVDLLDLRPIGFNVQGNSSGLHAGGASFSRNTFNGVGALIAFGVEP